MAYIGNPVQQALTKVTSQSFNGTGSQTVFTLNRAVNTGEELEVFVNNVQQEPGVGKSYTATGTTLTFDAAPSSGTGNIYVIYRGLAEVTRRLQHDPNAALAATTGTFSGDLTVDTNTLYVDSTNNRVGIGTATPNEALTIEAPLSGDTGLAINYSGDNKAGITVNPTTGQIQVGAHPDLTSANAYYLSFNTASSNTVYERMKIDSSGRVTMPYQPALMASATGNSNFTSVSSSTAFPANTAYKNVGGHYNTTTYRFTAPVDGFYLFCWSALTNNTTSQSRPTIMVNGSTSGHVGGFRPMTGNDPGALGNMFQVITYLSVNDYVSAASDSGDLYFYGAQHNAFSGTLLS